MNKTELVAAVAEKAEISKKDADSAVNAVIESIIEAVASKDKVPIYLRILHHKMHALFFR